MWSQGKYIYMLMIIIIFAINLDLPCVTAPDLSVQGRRGSASNRRSADCKGDLGSGRSIPIKQVGQQQEIQRNLMLSTAFFKRNGSYLSSKAWRQLMQVLEAESGYCVGEATQDFFFCIPPPNKFWHPCSVPYSRVSCWSAVETHSTKSGRRSTWRWLMTASCPIIRASTWVRVSTQRREGIRTAGRERRVSNRAAVCFGRTTCSTSPAKRWTCWEWRWRCLANDRPVPSRPAASLPAWTGESKTPLDLRMLAQVKNVVVLFKQNKDKYDGFDLINLFHLFQMSKKTIIEKNVKRRLK